MSKLPYPAKGKKLHWTKYHANYERVILDSLVDSDATTDTEKARAIKEFFETANRPHLDDGYYKTRHEAMSSWLSGVALDIPYSHHYIIQLAKACGSVGPDLTDKQEEDIALGYFDFMAVHVLRVINKHTD